MIPEPSYRHGLPSEDTPRSLESPDGYSASLSSLRHQEALDDFTEKWSRGEISDAGAYLDGMGHVPSSLAVELIYREYCLAELKGIRPDPDVFLARFPAHRELLARLFSVHHACSSSQLDYWIDPTAGSDVFPKAGDEIGPYLLRRELGRGAFARVFLAEQSDLENRLVILKLSTRRSREPWLLARARHSHIVEILSHAVVDDGAFQLICMPFLGGATLSSVLELRRQLRRLRPARRLVERPRCRCSPRVLLRQSGASACEILGRLNDCQAMAWITARLADALDHAQCRDVIHGDVKPSNILLTADGNPMLLDFNLARNWSFDKNNSPLDELGGTLAYMVPERLSSLASSGAAPVDTWQSSEIPLAKGNDPHSADIYSLGIVLLEALTSTTPAEAMRKREVPEPAPREPRSIAAEYGSFRERGAAAVIGAFESAAGRKVPPALHAILDRCLAVRPEDRYRRALELAEDLDRWRADLPLAYAPEPFWAQTVPRCVRQNAKLLSVVGVVLAACLVTTYLVMMSRIQSRTRFEEIAAYKLARNWDDMESHAFQFQRPQSPRLQNPDAQEVVTTAIHALKEYDVFGRGDWRQREEVRNLPRRDRDDLSLWLMEQAFRYCRSLRGRPNSPDDWHRAIDYLDRLSTTPPLQAFETLRRRLLARLDQSKAHATQVRARARSRPCRWPEPSSRCGGRPSRPGLTITCSAWPRSWKPTTIRNWS